MSGLREVHFGQRFHNQPYIARFVEHFYVERGGCNDRGDSSDRPCGSTVELWLVFEGAWRAHLGCPSPSIPCLLLSHHVHVWKAVQTRASLSFSTCSQPHRRRHLAHRPAEAARRHHHHHRRRHRQGHRPGAPAPSHQRRLVMVSSARLRSGISCEPVVRVPLCFTASSATC